MSVATDFPENAYQFRDDGVLAGWIKQLEDGGLTPASAQQAQASVQPVSDAWARANQTYLGRRYPDAVVAYRATRSAAQSVRIADPTSPAGVATATLANAFANLASLGMAEAHHALGAYVNAEAAFLQVGTGLHSDSAPFGAYVWLGLGNLYLEWGDSLFRADEPAPALGTFVKVVLPDRSAPSTALYTNPVLKAVGDSAKSVIAAFGPAGSPFPHDTAHLRVNPAIVAVVCHAYQQVVKLVANLDFWGQSRSTVPIWTFEYLQSLAMRFAQLATTTERDVINFWDRADQASLTRAQIAQNVQQSQAEVQAAQFQAQVAGAETAAYGQGAALAQQRSADAARNAQEYAATAAAAIVHQALAAQMTGGDDGNADVLNNYASAMLSGPYSLSGSRATLAAAEQLTAYRLNQQYEVDSMKRQAAELRTAAAQAQAELAAAQARSLAAQAGVLAAVSRAASAQGLLDTFDQQTFTPELWLRMGNTLFRLYQRYLAMALQTARLMQHAYNFETDQELQLIRSDYSTDEVRGLLGADALMADIQSFSYDLVTSTRGKAQPLKHTISLAERYGYAFETQFRKTGAMDFETRFDDFDLHYPGTYAGRIENVEVEVLGIVPVSGISGTLTNSGISAYRVPSDRTHPTDSGFKFRMQPRETLIVSDFVPRQDALLSSTDQRARRVFQGAGVASTWHLEFSPAVNDINYGALTDVLLTFTYTARYDPGLADMVKAQLAMRPSLNAGQRGMPLRWLYPDAFYHFQETGTLQLTLEASGFHYNESAPKLTMVDVQLAMDGTLPAAGLKVRLATPGHGLVLGQAAASGIISSGAPSSPWAPLVGGSALGEYTISMTAADNPALVKNDKLDLRPVTNVALILGYSYTPRTQAAQAVGGGSG